MKQRKGNLIMQTDGNWNDVCVYAVNFSTLDGRHIEKILIFPEKFTKEIIEKAVLKRFRQIDKVERIEAWCGALSSK